MAYLTKATALMEKRLRDIVGSYANQARITNKLVSTNCNNTCNFGNLLMKQ
jgi:hypothetical protein